MIFDSVQLNHYSVKIDETRFLLTFGEYHIASWLDRRRDVVESE